MTATKLKLAISAILVASAATALVVQYQAQEKLRAENGSLQQQILQLQTDNAGLSNQVASAGDLSKSTGDQFNELLKLRGEVGVLRRQTNELGELEDENRQLREQISDAQSSKPSEEQQKQTLMARLRDAHGYVSGFIKYAEANNGQFPTNWDQLSSYTNEPGGVEITGTNTFEIINQTPLNLYNLGTNGGSILLIASPTWLSSNGKWVKSYGFADGHSEIMDEPAGGFDAFEQQHTIAPPNQ